MPYLILIDPVENRIVMLVLKLGRLEFCNCRYFYYDSGVHVCKYIVHLVNACCAGSESEAGSDVSSEDEEQQLDNQLSEMKDAEMKDLKRYTRPGTM